MPVTFNSVNCLQLCKDNVSFEDGIQKQSCNVKRSMYLLYLLAYLTKRAEVNGTSLDKQKVL